MCIYLSQCWCVVICVSTSEFTSIGICIQRGMCICMHTVMSTTPQWYKVWYKCVYVAIISAGCVITLTYTGSAQRSLYIPPSNPYPHMDPQAHHLHTHRWVGDSCSSGEKVHMRPSHQVCECQEGRQQLKAGREGLSEINRYHTLAEPDDAPRVQPSGDKGRVISGSSRTAWSTTDGAPG